MKIITGTVKISTGGSRGKDIREFDVTYPEFASLREAATELGRNEALQLLNQAVATEARLKVRHRVLTLASDDKLGRIARRLSSLGIDAETLRDLVAQKVVTPN